MSHLREVIREIRRCRKNIADGGNPEFWIARLQRAAIEHEQASEKLRLEEATVRKHLDASNAEALR